MTDRSDRRFDIGSADQRAEFERDRDRILYSSAFHRLAGITQIVRAGEANVFHTRQQHTLKVAQVGRRLAQKLLHEQPEEASFRGLDPEVVEAACLAHDLGHPPFGHIGEQALDQKVTKSIRDGFEGNAQSFRIVTKLSVRYASEVPGINLTRATLAACLKYPWMRGNSGKQSKKWSAYASEEDDFHFARAGLDHEAKTLEAEIMDWADDVAYSVHDLEDFHRCNALPWQRVFSEKDLIIEHAMKGEDDASRRTKLEDAYDRLEGHINGTYSILLSEPYEGEREQREQLRRMTSFFIGRYINGIKIQSDQENPISVVHDEDYFYEVQILKQITRDYIIASPTLAAQQHGQREIICDLFDFIFEEIEGSHNGIPAFLPRRLRYLKDLSGGNHARFACDCVASLSESEAIALHARLTGAVIGSVLDPIVR